MFSLIEIKKAIVKKLKFIQGVNIVANDIKSGFDKPAFFVQIMPLGTSTDCDLQESSLNVYIHYFSESKAELENLKMIDTLNQLFVTTLTVNGVPLTLCDKDSDTDNNVLKYMFTLRYTEDTPNAIDEDVEIYENMNDLYINL